MAPSIIDRIEEASRAFVAAEERVDAAVKQLAEAQEEKKREYLAAMKAHQEKQEEAARDKALLKERRDALDEYLIRDEIEDTPELRELMRPFGLEALAIPLSDEEFPAFIEEMQRTGRIPPATKSFRPAVPRSEPFAFAAPQVENDDVPLAAARRKSVSSLAPPPSRPDDSDDDDVPLALSRRQSGYGLPAKKTVPSTAPRKRVSFSPATYGQSLSSNRRTTDSNVIDLSNEDSDGEFVPETKKAKTGRRSLPSASSAGSSARSRDAILNSNNWESLNLAKCIIKTPEGEWLELRCPECQGNTSPHTKDFLKGVNGFLVHIKKSHDWPGQGWIGAADYCKVREVPLDEVKKILNGSEAGKPYVEMIPVESDTNVTAKGKKERDQNSKDWSFCKKPANFLPLMSCVIRHPEDGHWVEIACNVCGGNFSPSRGTYLNGGLKGFWDHISHSHDPLHGRMPGGPRKIIEVLKVRDLTDAEAEALRKGTATVQAKPVFSTVKQGYKSETLKKRSRDEMEQEQDDGEETVEDTTESYVARIMKAKAEKEAADVGSSANNHIDLTQEDNDGSEDDDGDEDAGDVLGVLTAGYQDVFGGNAAPPAAPAAPALPAVAPVGPTAQTAQEAAAATVLDGAIQDADEDEEELGADEEETGNVNWSFAGV